MANRQGIPTAGINGIWSSGSGRGGHALRCKLCRLCRLYSARANQFARWCLLHGPELIGRDRLPDPAKDLTVCLRLRPEFTIDKDGRPLPVSAVQAFCSAIRYLYMRKWVLVADETEVEVSRVVKAGSQTRVEEVAVRFTDAC